MSEVNHVWRLRKRPVGDICEGDLTYEEEPMPEPADEECLFRLNYLSLDATNRMWMSDVEQYMPPVDINAPMRGVVCGTVIQSKNSAFKKGDIVSGLGTWADYQIGTTETVSLLGDTGPVPVIDAFGTFAIAAPTAYFGLLEITKPKSGETVVISTAAGSVGSIVGQIAKIKGCHVVGLTGTDEKCKWITEELGFDEAINYKTEDLSKALERTCPNGIDVYFENVGGEILDTCLKHMNMFGRISVCGLIAHYNSSKEVPGPKNYPMILMNRLKVEGFIILDYMDRYPEAITAITQWMAEGKIKVQQDVVDGLENAVETVKKLYTGTNTGKLMVRVKDV
jgi:NADPH-dependent curcumin reductase CurA|tara:strand:- start:85 stop:1098 length:1014 start_codon:yes stop_codon:yes gene_type:complete